MSAKAYGLVTSVLFAVIGLVQLLRIVFQWEVTINSWALPVWPSIVAVLVAGFLSYAGCRAAKEAGNRSNG